MNGVIFVVSSADELSRIEPVIKNPVIAYNHLLSITLCYNGEDGASLPKFVTDFAEQFDVLVASYSKAKEIEITRNIARECDAIFQIQRELCLKKISSNPLFDYILSFVLIAMTSFFWMKMYY